MIVACMNEFLQAATGTGNKKGCLLIQFPGKITLEHFNQVEQILDDLRIYDPASGMANSNRVQEQ